MSDLSLLAAILAQASAADQANPNQPELPVISGLSSQAKYQAVQPIALELHQASIETYQAEFSRTATTAPVKLALPIQVIPAPKSAEMIRELQTPATTAPQGINLAEAIPNILPEPVKLSLRPILTRRGGSISALPPSVRPIALKLHQASIETYATTLALAPQVGQPVIAQVPSSQATVKAKTSVVETVVQPSVLRAPVSGQTAAAKPQAKSQNISLTATATLSPAALALGMAQAAGAAQGVTDAGVEASSLQGANQGANPGANSKAQATSLLASAPIDPAPVAPSEPKKLSAAQAAIALDQKVRAELAQEEAAVSQAQATSAKNSPLWASPSTYSHSGNVIQLAPETVARAQAAPGTVTASPQPTIAIAQQPSSGAPSTKQAIAVAPSARRAATQPSLSPFQLPPSDRNVGANLGPRSGPQLYQQRLAALKQGRLYSRLPMDSFKSIWQGVRHKPSYGQWKRLLAAEARAVGGGQGNNRLSVVLGDSLSLWLPMQQLPSSQLWLNQGISGDTTAGILKRLDPLKETSPSNIYVMAGVNDLKNGATDDQVAQNLQQIMRRLRQQHPQAQIHVQSILPASIGLPPGRIRNLNERLARVAQTEQVAFLDIYPQFAAPNGQMIAQLTTDGIHLSPQGYALWQSILHRMAEPWAFANRGGKWGRS